MGYVIGSQGGWKPLDRLLIGLIMGFIGGIIVGIVLGFEMEFDESKLIISLIACIVGTLFGETLNWAPPPKKEPKRHVYFEPEDDDEFDREIEEALGGST